MRKQAQSKLDGIADNERVQLEADLAVRKQAQSKLDGIADWLFTISDTKWHSLHASCQLYLGLNSRRPTRVSPSNLRWHDAWIPTPFLSNKTKSTCFYAHVTHSFGLDVLLCLCWCLILLGCSWRTWDTVTNSANLVWIFRMTATPWFPFLKSFP